MLDAAELARSACRVFGHRWERPKFAASRRAEYDDRGARLRIRRQRTCSRCGETEVLER